MASPSEALVGAGWPDRCSTCRRHRGQGVHLALLVAGHWAAAVRSGMNFKLLSSWPDHGFRGRLRTGCPSKQLSSPVFVAFT